MRGFFLKMRSFKINSILNTLLTNINVEDFNWLILESEVYKKADPVDYDGKYTGKEFKKALKDLDACYIVRINIQASKKVIDAVKDYEDYMNSECELAILVTDVAYNEIYCKSSELCDIMKNNCLKLDYSQFDVTNDDNDYRTGFQVG
ncbi:MAG: DUF2691 family protein [Lachnospiraceae bacterium]|nr:DUF2691 family protein [Lachnospiraceae bacterium]